MPQAGRAGKAEGKAEAGAVLAEYAVVVPALLLLVFGLFQFAAWYLAGEVALAAAQEAARAARVETGSVEAGHAAAQRFLGQANGGKLVNPQVTVVRGVDNVRVDVRGTAQSVVPGLVLPVHEASAGEVERFRGSAER
jgi:Flp pilus assembly protein TadG